MAMIHLARDGAKLGSFSEEEVRDGLRSGKFRPTDLAWQEGMSEWRPLGQVLPDVPAASPAVEPTAPVSSPVPVVEATPSNAGLPWERRQELGFLKAFIDTVSMVLTRPAEAFSVMKSGGDMVSPMLFALIGGSVGVIISILFQLAIGSVTNQRSWLGAGIAGSCGS